MRKDRNLNTDTRLSMTAIIEALRPGDSHSHVERVPVTKANRLTRIAARLRNNINQAVMRVSEKTLATFVVETGHFVNRKGDAIFVCVVVTRSEDDLIDDI